jgi:hypothetical protein
MSVSTDTTSSRAVVVWQPRPTILERLKSIPPVVIVAAAALATYAALPLAASLMNGNAAQPIVAAAPQRVVPATPVVPPAPPVVEAEPPATPARVAPPRIVVPAPANPVAFVAPLVAAVAPLVVMPRQNSALAAARDVVRVERQIAPMMRPMRAFAPMMRGGFPIQRFAGGFPRGGFGLARGFGRIRLFGR